MLLKSSPSPTPHPPAMGSTDPRSLDLLKELRDLAKKRHAEVRVPLCHLEGETGGQRVPLKLANMK